MQFAQGTVSISSDSHVVSGSGCSFLSTATPGGSIVIPSLGFSGQISRVVGNNELWLSDVVRLSGGPEWSGLSYQLSLDFTPGMQMPVPRANDVDKAELVRRSIEILDRNMERFEGKDALAPIIDDVDTTTLRVRGRAISGRTIDVDFGALGSKSTVATGGVFSVMPNFGAARLTLVRARYTGGPWSDPFLLRYPITPESDRLAGLLRYQNGMILDFASGRFLSTIPTSEGIGQTPERLTFARASAASYIDATGKVQTAASGQQRLTHDPATLSPLGVMIEGARTNLLANPTWAGPAVPTSWASYSPEGVALASSKFGANVGARRFTATGNRPRVYQSVSMTANVTYVASVRVEELTGSTAAQWVVASVTGNTTMAFPVCEANPTGGAYGVVRTGLLVVQITSTVTQAVTIQFGLGVQSAQTGVTIDLSMPQIEASTYPTTFIPGGARAAESLFTTLPFDPQSGITMAVKFRAPMITVPGATLLVALYNGVSTVNLLNVYVNTGNMILAGAGSFLMTGTSLALGAMAPSSEQRFAFSVSPTGECRVSRNGQPTLSRGLASGTMPAGMTRLDLMNLGGTLQAQTSLACIAIWKGMPFADADFRGLLS